MIISISGFINSGKDSVADYLVNEHNFVRASWADSVKDSVSVIFGWDRELLEGRTLKSRAWRETVDIWWADRLGISNLTPRLVLQEYATEIMRDNFHSEIWIASLERKLLAVSENVVITDCRFINELQCVKRLGGITTRVVRGDDPEWLDEYKRSGRTLQFAKKYKNIHASEYSSIEWDYDCVIDNNGPLAHTYESVKNLLLNLHESS